MNLNEFLVYLNNGAYSVARYLLVNSLTLQDRKNLRQVSRTINSVMLGFPLLTTLHVSTHKADVDYLELVSKNEKLLRHVTLLSWDHSIHEILLLQENMYMRYSQFWGGRLQTIHLGLDFDVDFQRDLHQIREDEVLSPRILDAKPAIVLWVGLARCQKFNLERNRDYMLVMKILPLLKNLESVRFVTHDFGALKCNPSIVWSPAMQQWSDIPDKVKSKMPSPLERGWRNLGGTYLPDLSLQVCPSLAKTVFPVKKPEHDIWHRLPVRGIKFFDALARKESGSSNTAGLQHFFPKLTSIEITGMPMDFLMLPHGGSECRFLRRSTPGIRRLDLTIPLGTTIGLADGNEVEHTAYRAPIKALVLPAASSLQYLSLTHLLEDNFAPPRPTPLQIAIEVLPQLPALRYLAVAGGVTARHELENLADAIRVSPSLRELFLSAMSLEGESWATVLHSWRVSRALNRLTNIQLDAVKDRSRNGWGWQPKLFTRNFGSRSSSIVRWLKGEESEYPLYNDRLSLSPFR